MNNALLRPAMASMRNLLDRKTLSGLFLGMALTASALVLADGGDGSDSWFTNIFGPPGDSSSLLSQQDSVVATAIKQEVDNCGQPGTIGAAIQTAMNVHEQMAAPMPNVESLFDVNTDCFSSISQIFDLSSAIPSLASIISAAESAMLKYAQKKVCTATKQVTGLVTTPINQAISSVNQLQGLSSINGMGQLLTSIDPNLGSQFQTGSTTSSTYTVNTNPFGTSQTSFDSSTSTGGSSGSSQLTDYTSQITALTQQIANTQIQINDDQTNLQTAQSNYSGCSNSDSGCLTQFAALQAAQQKLVTDQQSLISQQSQMSNVVTQTGSPTTSQTTTSSGTTSSGTSSGCDWWCSVTNLFN
jgi:hypothetical protein